MKSYYPPGGVIKKLAGANIPKDIVARAMKFARSVDAGGMPSKKFQILKEYVVSATKSPNVPYVTVLRIIEPQGNWITSAYTSPFFQEDGFLEYHLHPTDQGPVVTAGSITGGVFGTPDPEVPDEFVEFDKANVFDYPKYTFIAGDLSGGSLFSYFVSRLNLSRYHVATTVSRQLGSSTPPGFNYSQLTVYVYTNQSAKTHPWDREKDPPLDELVPATAINATALLLGPADLADAFGGAQCITDSLFYQNFDTVWDTDGGIKDRPAFAYVLKNEVSGKYDRLAVIVPLQRTNLNDVVGYTHVLDAYENFDNGNGTAPTGRQYLCGHGVALYDISITAEQLEDAVDAEAPIPLGERKIFGFSRFLDEYGLDNVGQTYEGYMNLPTQADAPSTPEVDEDTLERENYKYCDASERNHIVCLAAGFRQRKIVEPPAEPPVLKPGERAPYYGLPQIITAVSTVHAYHDPSAPDKEFPYENPGDRTQSTRYLVYAHMLFVGTIGEDGTYTEEGHELESSTHWVGTTITELVDEVPTIIPSPHSVLYLFPGEESPRAVYFSHPPGAIRKHYFYMPCADGIPAVIVPTDEWLFATDNVPLEETPGETAFIGHQYLDQIEFAIFFPEAGNGYTKVVYDLNGYEPPRPIMYGLSKVMARWCSTNGEPLGQFSYRREDFSPVTLYSTILQTTRPAADEMSQLEGSPGPNFGERDALVPPEGMVIEDPEVQYFSSRRFTNAATDQQRIHGQLGVGRIAVLATNNAAADSVFCDWSVVVCHESTGAFVRVSAPIPRVYDERGYPLESSNWISLNVVSHEETNADGDVVKPAILVVSIDKSLHVAHNNGDRDALGHMIGDGENRPYIAVIHGHRSSGTLQELVWPRTGYDDENNLNTKALKFISSDGGETWLKFLENIPGDIYYLGNKLFPREHLI